MFLAHTEGDTYSGRLKYLLNCHSVVVSPQLKWIAHYHHLLSSSPGKDRNYIKLDRDFSNLRNTMDKFFDNPSRLQEKGRQIADNARRTFRERYLTPAAEACYWRAMIRGWASVQGFKPQLWVDTEGQSFGRNASVIGRRRPRGVPFESYANHGGRRIGHSSQRTPSMYR